MEQLGRQGGSGSISGATAPASLGRAAANAAIVAFLATLAHLALYQSLLFFRLTSSDDVALSSQLVYVGSSFARFLAGIRFLVPLAISLALLAGLLGAGLAAAGRRARGLTLPVLAALSLAVGLASATHVRLLVLFHTGFDRASLLQAGALSWSDVRESASLPELLLAASAPVLTLLAFRRLADARQALPGTIAAVLAAAGLLASLVSPPHPSQWRLISYHPLQEMAVRWARENRLPLTPQRVGPLQRQRLTLVDPLFALPEPRRVPALVVTPGPPFRHVVIVILESTGARRLDRHPAAMPFLRTLAAQGAAFTRHYSAGNDSPTALFALFSGVYPDPVPGSWATGRHAPVPSFTTRLTDRDRFFVSACDLHSWFPLSFLRPGFPTLLSRRDLPGLRPAPETSGNDLEAMDRFLALLTEASDHPSLGTFFTTAPHVPYFDQDPEHRWIRPARTGYPRHLNALRLEDRLLERLVARLRELGRSDDTLLVVVGDHGEALGEHGAKAHGRSSIEEILRTPLVFYSPARIPPQRIDRLTSHVDLAPTLLSLLGVPFDADANQGESLLSPETYRRYVFAYGSEVAMSSVSQEGMKMTWEIETDACSEVDLVADPGENAPRSCDEHPAQLTALRELTVFQRWALSRGGPLAAGAR